MRLLLLTRLTALLPLRTWVGDVMAMTSGPPIAIQNIATSAHYTGARGIFSINSGLARTLPT